MHTRKRALAGVTAGALALGVLAFSPVAPASAAPDPGQPGSTMAYIAGSLSGVPVPTVPGSGGDVAAVITTNETVGVFGRHRVSVPDADPPATTYNALAADITPPIFATSTGPYWSDVTSSGATVALDSGIASLSGPLAALSAVGGKVLFVKSSAAKNTTATVTFFRDQNNNGIIDVAEQSSAQLPITLRFAPASDVFVYTTTNPTPSTQAYTLPAFYAVPVVDLSNPLLQDVDGPITWPPAAVGGPGATSASGLNDWTSGSFASLNGDTAVAADNDLAPLDGLGLKTGLIYAEATGVIRVTGWFDPTGTVPGDGPDIPNEAPLTPPAGFKTGSATLNVVSQTISSASSITASGTGVVLDGPVYSAPLTTTTVNFAVDVLRNNIMNNDPLPFANTPVQVRLNWWNNDGATFKANGSAVTDGQVLSLTTDANGKVNIALDVNVGTNPRVNDTMEVTATLVSVNGSSAPEYVAPGDPLCDYVPFWACTSPDTPSPIDATVIWNKAGRMSYYKSSGSINDIPFFLFGGGLRIYSSVLSNTTSAMTVNLVDTFGNVIPGRHVTVDTDCGDEIAPTDAMTVGATTNANGSVTFGIPGQVNGYKYLCVHEDDENRELAYGVILYKPQAQLTTGGIDAPPRQREWVTLNTDFPDWTQVTFRVKDSAGDPMGGVAGTASTSLGVIARDDMGNPAYDGYTGSTLPVIVGPNGLVTVWVASTTTGTARVTLNIGGKSKSALVDFSNRGIGAETLTIGPAGGGEVPASVAPHTEIRMQVAATDHNGNNLEGAYVLIKVKGNARINSGGRQKVVFTGRNGKATFKVKSGKSGGSFEVVAITDGHLDGYSPAGGYFGGYRFEGPIVKARTGSIDIK